MSLTPGITSSFTGNWTGVMATAHTNFVLKVIVSLTCIVLSMIFSLPVIFSKMLDFICVLNCPLLVLEEPVQSLKEKEKSEKENNNEGFKRQ